MLRRFALSVLVVVLGFSSSAVVTWTNVDEDHYVAGRKCSAGYLVGKVVLLCSDQAMAERMEEVWTSFKTKPFVLIGAYATAPKGVSYSVYKGALPTVNTSAKPASILVFDETGCIRYRGSDDRKATEMVVTLVTDMASPKSEAQWRQLLDFELEHLPGHAYLRYLDFKKQFPTAAKDYSEKAAELMKIPDIKKLAELVRFANSAKDMRAIDPKKARLVKSRLKGKIEETMKKFAPLKESENPLVVQEAKNALADLSWAKAAL